jgi:hypothetical protein
MALMMECAGCLHVQMVAIIPNGRGGFPDPHHTCTQCPSVGRYSLPGAAARRDAQIAELAVALTHVSLPHAQKRVLAAVRREAASRPGSVGATRIRELVLGDVSYDAANRAMKALVQRGLLDRPARGRYLPAEATCAP